MTIKWNYDDINENDGSDDRKRNDDHWDKRNRGESFCRLCFLRDPEMLRLWKAHRGGEQIMKAVKIGQTNMKIILDEILNYVKRS